MRIALVIHEFPPLAGGAATAAAKLAREFASEHDVAVITANAPGAPPREEIDGVEIVRLPAWRQSQAAPDAIELAGFCVAAYKHLRGELARFRPDAVLAFFAVPAGWFAVRAARRLGVPAIVSLRGSDVPGFSNGRLRGPLLSFARWPIRSVLRHADALIANGEHLAGLAQQFEPGAAARLNVVANGVDADCIAGEPPDPGGEDFRLVQVSQLVPRKRVERTLEVVDQLRRLGIPARATIIGDGPLRPRLEALARKLAIANYVEFTGFLPREEVQRRLRVQHVFLVPSRAEGISNAVLEAMAAGLPILIADNGSHHVVAAASCGEVFSLDQSDELADLTQRCAAWFAQPDLRLAYGRAGLAFARQNTWRDCAERFLDVIERVVTEPRSRANDPIRSR